jgi:hypothetical protein
MAFNLDFSLFLAHLFSVVKGTCRIHDLEGKKFLPILVDFDSCVSKLAAAGFVDNNGGIIFGGYLAAGDYQNRSHIKTSVADIFLPLNSYTPVLLVFNIFMFSHLQETIRMTFFIFLYS